VKRWELVFEGEPGILLDARHGCPFECTELVYAESVGASSSHVSDGASGVDGFEALERWCEREAQEANDPEPQEANDPEPQPQEANDPEPQEANVPEPQDANDPEP
jgi:hypothetical protein